MTDRLKDRQLSRESSVNNAMNEFVCGGLNRQARWTDRQTDRW